MLNKKSIVLFVTFSMWTNGQRMPTNGNLEPLRNFLVARIKRLILIDQPHPGSDRVIPMIEDYSGSKLKFVSRHSSWWMYLLWPILKLNNTQGTQAIFKIRDYLSVFDWIINSNLKYNYFIGLECINTFAGILFKKFGKIDKVIYYVLDYSPNRYTGFLNYVYIWLDHFCAKHADYIWDVSKAIQSARIMTGLTQKQSAPEVHVPIGIYPNQIILNPLNKRKPFSICYMGSLSYEQGPDLAIEMMPLILNKYPLATLHIIGGGQTNLERLRKLVKSLKIENHVFFYGFVVKSSDMAKILSSCYVAVAPYRAIEGSIREYGDSSKMRSYAAAGLPIVTTQVPPLGKLLQDFGGALVANDTKNGLYQNISLLFSNKNLYARMREKVIKFAKSNTWVNEFTKAFAKSQ